MVVFDVRKMKDSGIEWIKEIPGNWAIMPNKYLMRKEKNIQPVYHGEDILSLTMNGVIVRDLDAGGKMPTSFDGYQKIEKGNLLMCLFDIDVTPRCVGLIKNNGLTSPAYSQFVLNDIAIPEYYCYYYTMLDNDKTMLHLAKNLRHSLTEEQLGVIPTVVPPVSEQIKIANFLDEKCAEIDLLVNDIQQQIEVLEQYKRSVITETVTKGLDPNVEMKDSGVQWIGRINANYEISRLKYIADILDEYRKPITADQRNQNSEILYDYYGASGVIDKIDGYTIDDHVMLIGEDGANLKMRNLPIMYEVNGKAWINNHAHILKPKENVNFYYLFYMLEAMDINPYITGSAQPKFNQEALKNMYVIVPDYKEQNSICLYLQNRCREIVQGIIEKNICLEYLNEYKQSVIYEYITGKRMI